MTPIALKINRTQIWTGGWLRLEPSTCSYLVVGSVVLVSPTSGHTLFKATILSSTRNAVVEVLNPGAVATWCTPIRKPPSSHRSAVFEKTLLPRWLELPEFVTKGTSSP